MAVLQLFACKNWTLLVRRDARLVLDFGFDILNGVTGLDLKGDGLHRDLHRGVVEEKEGGGPPGCFEGSISHSVLSGTYESDVVTWSQ